jgi:DNA-binding MarR family transcriptional regulator
MNPHPAPLPQDVLRRAQAASAMNRTALSRRVVFDAVIARPGAQAVTLADITGRSPSTVRRMLSALISDGIVEVYADSSDSRTRRYRVTPPKCTCPDPWCVMHYRVGAA